MAVDVDGVLRRTTIFRRLSADDRQRLLAGASVRGYEKGALPFSERGRSGQLYTGVRGRVSARVKAFKTTARGTDVILEIFGPGDPVGPVAVYEARPYPASAMALEPTTCLLLSQQAFFSLLETYPTMVRGLLTGLTHRLVE